MKSNYIILYPNLANSCQIPRIRKNISLQKRCNAWLGSAGPVHRYHREHIETQVIAQLYLVGLIPTPLKKKSHLGWMIIFSIYGKKTCSKLPTRYGFMSKSGLHVSSISGIYQVYQITKVCWSPNFYGDDFGLKPLHMVPEFRRVAPWGHGFGRRDQPPDHRRCPAKWRWAVPQVPFHLWENYGKLVVLVDLNGGFMVILMLAWWGLTSKQADLAGFDHYTWLSNDLASGN